MDEKIRSLSLGSYSTLTKLLLVEKENGLAVEEAGSEGLGS